jgi:hypothetical protein
MWIQAKTGISTRLWPPDCAGTDGRHPAQSLRPSGGSGSLVRGGVLSVLSREWFVLKGASPGESGRCGEFPDRLPLSSVTSALSVVSPHSIRRAEEDEPEGTEVTEGFGMTDAATGLSARRESRSHPVGSPIRPCRIAGGSGVSRPSEQGRNRKPGRRGSGANPWPPKCPGAAAFPRRTDAAKPGRSRAAGAGRPGRGACLSTRPSGRLEAAPSARGIPGLRFPAHPIGVRFRWMGGAPRMGCARSGNLSTATWPARP